MSEYKAGDKFVIEIGDSYNNGSFSRDAKLYRIKGFRSLVFDKNGLEKLTPYDEIKHKLELIDELKRDEYNRGLNDAWELARKVGKYDGFKLREIFGLSEYLEDFEEGESPYSEVMKMTPQEALAKLEAYEKSKDEIKVGDVVTIDNDSETIGIVIHLEKNWANLVHNDGLFSAAVPVDTLTKTGKHIDISALLEEIGED